MMGLGWNKGPLIERRKLRVGREVYRVLTKTLLSYRFCERSLMNLVTISRVRMSSDLKHARVYILSSRDGDLGDVSKLLMSHTRLLRTQLKEKLTIKHVPFLTFSIDNSFIRGNLIDELLESRKVKDDLST